MKKLVYSLIFMFTLVSFVQAQWITIDSVRKQDANGVPLLLGQTVTVRGIVTTQRELGAPLVYFQVPSAGLVAYDATFGAGVNRGDSVQVTGLVTHYSGLTELQPVSSFTVLATGKTVNPINVTPANIRTNGELYEGRLVRIDGITQVKTTNGVVAINWNTASSGTNYRIFVGNDSCEIRIYTSTNIAGTTIPPYPFSVVALSSQYMGSNPTPPYLSGYQIIPRDLNDIIATTGGPVITANPIESNITRNSITLNFTTLSAGDTKVKYFVSDSLYQPVVFTDSVYNASQVTSHTVNLTNLLPGKIYYALVSSTNTTGTSSVVKYFSTASPIGSTGAMEVYFNFPVDTTVALPNNKANGSTNFQTRLGQMIDAATSSIDFAIYSFNDLTPIKDKIINAFSRGVKIRIVYDYREGVVQSLMQELIAAGIPVQIRPSSSYIMHNKFFVFNGRDTSAHSTKWLWAGSANITYDQFVSDAQNVILIQDESICNAYTREFEEMWGSHNNVNNPSQAKFGAAKSDNTPHVFNVNGKRVEIYFGPSDGCTAKFINLLNNEPNKSINFCIYSFTQFTIANKMKAKYNLPNLMVRGVFDQSNASNTLYQEMKGIGGSSPWNPPARVYLETFNGLMHDKYTIIDADLMTSNPVVETGSFNYTNAADQGNDENMMFIYDSLIANQYYQDFVKRITDAGGSVDIKRTSFNIPENFRISQNFPNPFNPSTQFKLYIPNNAVVKVVIHDILGRQVGNLIDRQIEAGEYTLNWNASSLPSGVYFYQLIANGVKLDVKKMVLKK